tara:strand:- start:1012 stop:1224 length:213 start_codon:yes stop_codon:yes gene_type:complete
MRHETLIQVVITPLIVAIVGIVGWSLINVVQLREDIATVKSDVKHISRTIDDMADQLALMDEYNENYTKN